jgi:hypothetical protein
MPVMPPCRANQAAAAIGVGWPPRSDTRDSAKADPLVQAGVAAATVTGVAGGAADRALPDPHADTDTDAVRRPVTMKPQNAAGCNVMIL